MTKKQPHVSRRQFMKSSAFLAAAPYIIPASALGKNGHVAPSNRLTVGMIGIGLMMRGHLKALSGRSDVQIVGVSDVYASKRNGAKTKVNNAYGSKKASGVYKGCQAFNEFEHLTENPGVDVCLIATPDHWHVPISLSAIRHGKDVYCEKPLSLTIREGRILADAVRRYGRVLQVGSQQRSNASFRKACEIVRNGWIGKVHTVYAKLGEFPLPAELPEQPVPEGLDYDRWLGPAPWTPYNGDRIRGSYTGGWRCYWEYGARKGGDWGAHHYDIIQWALGMEDSGPTNFFPMGYEGSKYLQFRYEGGPTVFRDHPIPGGHMIHFIGESGTVSVSRQDRLAISPRNLGTRPLRPGDIHLYASDNHHSDFFQAVRNRTRPIADVEIAHRSATICHLSAISHRLNRPLRWDPMTETIVGDELASRWLDRPRRAPYVL
jgi:predicted dehydrogenase